MIRGSPFLFSWSVGAMIVAFFVLIYLSRYAFKQYKIRRYLTAFDVENLCQTIELLFKAHATLMRSDSGYLTYATAKKWVKKVSHELPDLDKLFENLRS